MALQRYDVTFDHLPDDVMAQWKEIPAAIVGDMMNRSQVMGGRIKPIKHGMKMCGHARTVTCMSGDNSGPHRLIAMARPGEVLVIDARGVENVAIWGGIMTEAAIQRGVAGIVVDGAVRDVQEMRERDFPVWCSAVVPAGPHKNFGGIIDGPVAVGDCPVHPGDIICADDDGVSVVPLAWQEKMLKASHDKLAAEEATLEGLRNGDSTVDRLGIPEPEIIS